MVVFGQPNVERQVINGRGKADRNNCYNVVSVGDVRGNHDSVAQIARDFLGDSKVLVGLYEQTRTADLPHDELALLSSH